MAERAPGSDPQTRYVWGPSSAHRALLAVLARRKVAAVDGLLQELLRLVLPELGDRREGLDDRIPELALLLLDLSHVDVLDRVVVGIELDGAPRGVGDLDLPERGQEFLDLQSTLCGLLHRSEASSHLIGEISHRVERTTLSGET